MEKFQSFSSRVLPIFFFLLLILPAVIVSGDCTCDTDQEDKGGNSKREALMYKIGAIASILFGGALGVCIPILGKKFQALQPENDIFFMIKAFAAGVILSTGFIHILPDAFEQLTSPCLDQKPWGDFPFTGFVAMVSAIGTLMVDTFATSYFGRSHFNKANPVNSDEESDNVHVHTHTTHGHSHGSSAAATTSGDSGSELIRHRVISQVLELGILVHSIIIGISLGASSSPNVIKPLFTALTFHQFFEGMGLGGCITQARFKSRAVVVMVLFFSLTTPVGIAVGIGITNVYNENSPTALIVEGILDSAAAGILIYMSLVDLLAPDFMNPRMQSNLRLQMASHTSLLLGAGCMSLLAKWA